MGPVFTGVVVHTAVVCSPWGDKGRWWQLHHAVTKYAPATPGMWALTGMRTNLTDAFTIRTMSTMCPNIVRSANVTDKLSVARRAVTVYEKM